ncbi:MAG: MFS transporter [Alphaproteobacteria bacterium]
MALIPAATIPVLTCNMVRSLAFAPLSTILVLNLTLLGFGPRPVALLTMAGTAGLIVGSFFCHAIINRYRHSNAYALFAGVMSVGAILYWMLPPALAWYMIAFGIGMASFGSVVVIESWLQALSTNVTRGRVMSLYMILGSIGSVGGNLLVDVFKPQTVTPFLFAVVLVTVSSVPMLMNRRRMPPAVAPKRMSPLGLLKVSPLAGVSAVVSGLMQNAMWGLMPVFALSRDNLIGGVGLFMACFITGGVLAQYPVGRLSDLTSRRWVLFATYAATGSFALVTIALGGLSVTLLLVLVALTSGASATVYPQAAAYLNDYLDESQRIGASAGFLLLWSVGAILGPLGASEMMELAGPAGLFWFVAAVAACGALYTLHRRSVRSAPPISESPLAPTPQMAPAGAANIVEPVVEEAPPAAAGDGAEPPHGLAPPVTRGLPRHDETAP